MKATTTAIVTAAAAFLIAACVVFEDRIARVSSPEFADLVVDAGCTGSAEFIQAAIAGLNPTAATLIAEGVGAACALRANRTPISATVYDTALDSFCAETPTLASGDADRVVRDSFNQRRAVVCETRS